MPTMSEFQLVDHARSLERLQALMERVGVRMDPAEFISAVSNAYHAVTSDDYAHTVHDLFRTSGSSDNFHRVLDMASAALPNRISVLNIGCGVGYDIDMLAEVFKRDQLEHVLCSDLSPDMLAHAKERRRDFPIEFVVGTAADMLPHGPFDLVLTHSLVHHIPSLTNFLQDIAQLVKPGGIYVMGHEPNARYWRNPECLQVLTAWEQEQRQRSALKKWLDPQRYWSKLKRLLGLANDAGHLDLVNHYLRTHHGFRAPISYREMERLVDVHVPTRSPGDFSIGHEGFDPATIADEGLEHFRLLGYLTSGFLGHANPAKQVSHWQDENNRLGKKYPQDGSVFSALFQKSA